MKKSTRFLSLLLALGLTLGLTLGLCLPAGAWEVPYGNEGGALFVDDEALAQPEVRKAVEQFMSTTAKEGLPRGECQKQLNTLVYETLTGKSAADFFDDTPECRFDPTTGTLLEVLGDATILQIPEEIDGVTVRAIAPGAVTGKAKLEYLFVPQSVERVDTVIVRDCPELLNIEFMGNTAVVTCRVYENCPKFRYQSDESLYEETELRHEYRTTKALDGTISHETLTADLPQLLLTHLDILRGSETGMNWEGQLTRAEAAAILLRLLGLEEQAQAAAQNPSPFTDVPAWANGYVNLAYEKGMVKGVGNGKFDPSGLCGAREFSLMLLRLTDRTEGRDYAWATAIADLQSLVADGRSQMTWRGGAEQLHGRMDGPLFIRLHNDPAFTRQYACALVYRTLSIPMADGKTSLADKLCLDKVMSPSVLASFGIRLTSAVLGGRVDSSLDQNPLLLRTLLVSMDEDAKLAAFRKRADKVYSAELQALAAQLTAGLSDDYAKAKAICTWVANNIAYNYDQFEGREFMLQSADDMLVNRRGICDGYANLTSVLLSCAGIPNVYIIGYAGGAHAWNEVYADGRWFPVDNTWDSTLEYRYGMVTERSSDFRYFDMPYFEFYHHHTFKPELELPPIRFFS